MEVFIMTQEEQAKRVCERLDNEINKMRKMPKSEAKKYAIEKLIKIGICNADGSLAKLYGGKY